METYTPLKDFTDNPNFKHQRLKALAQLDTLAIDPPMVAIVKGLMGINYCFTLQSCYGHFLYPGQSDSKNTQPLPNFKNSTKIDYRIAYIAFCIENSASGKALLSKFNSIQLIDPDYIQLGCAEWFWQQQVNSFVIQIQPDRLKTKDRMTVNDDEARHIENVRNDVYYQLKILVD